MANSLTPQDVHSLMNDIVKEATGREDLKVIDTSSFVSVGETLLRVSAENTLNAISTVLARTIFSTRAYRNKLDILRADNARWGAMTRKIITLPMDSESHKGWNTDVNANALDDGNSVDMYSINKPKVIQLNFYGTKVLQMHLTRFKDQLALAFRSESEFIQFIDAVMREFANDVERLNEARSRAVIVNAIAGKSKMDNGVVDLTKEYNKKYGTTYTRAQLLNEHFESFLKFFVAEIKKYSDRLTDSTALYHANLANHPAILHHTPKKYQKMILYKPMFTDAEANVYSTIFNPKYLEVGEFEGVNFWQDPKKPTEIKCKPNILNVNTGESETSGTNVSLDYCVGILYDRDFMGVNTQFNESSTTPYNSAGQYWNMYMSWRFNTWTDYTENALVFIMGAGGAGDKG